MARANRTGTAGKPARAFRRMRPGSTPRARAEKGARLITTRENPWSDENCDRRVGGLVYGVGMGDAASLSIAIRRRRLPAASSAPDTRCHQEEARVPPPLENRPGLTA